MASVRVDARSENTKIKEIKLLFLKVLVLVDGGRQEISEKNPWSMGENQQLT